jgi:exonuclease III
MAKSRFTEKEWARIFARLNRHGTNLGLPAARTDTFVVASWNLRHFGGLAAKKADRARDIEAFRFIASVISRFDLVALQEVKDDLASLRQLHKLLPDYELVASDTTGNYERLAFLYRSGKVRHTDLAAEVDLPMDVVQTQMKADWQAFRDAFASYGKKIEKNPRFKGRIELPTTIGFERAPHCVSFDVGSPDQPLSFLAFNTHIFYGKKRDDRTLEFLAFLDWLYDRWSKVGCIFAPNFFVFGDMNAEVASDDAKTSRARILKFIEAADATCRTEARKRAKSAAAKKLVDSQITLFPFAKKTKWISPPAIGSNLEKDEYYDQIIMMLRTLEAGGPGAYAVGVFDIPKLVQTALGRRMTKHQKTYQTDRIRQQISDHLPIWSQIELNTVL